MVHMPSLEIWEWGLKIFGSALTLTTHVDHLLLYLHNQHAQTQSTNLYHYSSHVPHSTGKMIKTSMQWLILKLYTLGARGKQ